MKRLTTFFTLLLLVASCTKEIEISPNNDASREVVSFTASVVNPTDSRATLKNSWSGDEKVALFMGDKLYQYSIAADGTMSGSDIIVDRGEQITYTAFYPYDNKLTTIAEYEAACTSGEVDHMRASTTTSGKEVALQFEHSLAALSFTITIHEADTDPTIVLSLDGNLNTMIPLEVESSTSFGLSRLVANYFVESGADISSAYIKVEQSGSTTFHSIKREDSNTLAAGNQYPFHCTIGDIKTGSGTSDDPYMIIFADDMRKVGTGIDGWNMDSHYILALDIDLGGVDAMGNGVANNEFTAIGSKSSPFMGSFNGAGFTISGLYINRPEDDYQALFGYIVGGTVKDLGVSGSITGYGNVGSIAALLNNGSILNCHNTAKITGYNFVGGIVGCNLSLIECCYNNAPISGTANSVGGIAGTHQGGKINFCYNTASIEGANYVGGIVGSIYGNPILSCYSTASLSGDSPIGGIAGYIGYYGSASYSFFNEDYFNGSTVGELFMGSSASTSAPQTMEYMKSADFVTLINNDRSYWVEDTEGINDGYPILSWQTSNN